MGPARCVVTTGPRLPGGALLWGVFGAHGGSLVLDATGIRRADFALDVYSLRTPIPLLARWLRRDRWLCAARHPAVQFTGEWSAWTDDGGVVLAGMLIVRGRPQELLLSGVLARVGDREIVVWLTGNVQGPAVRSSLAGRLTRRGLRIELVAELAR
jgi:polyisoprenoid-binding protein YceI